MHANSHCSRCVHYSRARIVTCNPLTFGIRLSSSVVRLATDAHPIDPQPCRHSSVSEGYFCVIPRTHAGWVCEGEGKRQCVCVTPVIEGSERERGRGKVRRKDGARRWLRKWGQSAIFSPLVRSQWRGGCTRALHSSFSSWVTRVSCF